MSTPSYAPLLLSQHSLVESPGTTIGERQADLPTARAAIVRRVVACLDGSELGRSVVPHAQQISRALGAKLTLLHVLESDPGDGAAAAPADPLAWGIRRREARAHLQGVVSELDQSDSEIGAELIQGRPAEQICHWAANNDVDLTVLCSHGSHGLTEWDLASTARKLIERVPGSILLVPGSLVGSVEPVRYRRILVPLDGSARAESVIPTAMQIAAAEEAEVVFAHIVPSPEIFGLGLPDKEGADLGRRVVDHNRRVAAAYLDRLRNRFLRSGCRVRSLVLSDANVRTGLEQLVRDEKADLVVMSAHGSTGRLDTPCGSVTEYALAHASVPLLVLRERVRRKMRRVDQAVPYSAARFDSGEPTAS